MAKENIAFLVNLRKNTAVGTDREGRYYPEAESKEALTTKGFAKHVSEHGGLVTYEFMQLVLAAIVKCLKEMMSQGQPVKLLTAVRLSGGDRQEDNQRQGEVVHAAHAVVGLWHRGCRSRCRGRRLFDKLRDRRRWQH